MHQCKLVIIGLALFVSLNAAAFTVFDGANFSQNVLSAIRSLQTNINEGRSIANEIQMVQSQIRSLENDALNLQRLDWNTIDNLEMLLVDLGNTYSRASRSFGDLEQMNARYDEVYGGYTDEPFSPSEDYYQNANTRLKTGYNASKDAIEALQVLKSAQTDLENTNRTVEAGMGAEGVLQALQAQLQLQGQMIHEFKKLEVLVDAGIRQMVVAAGDKNLNQAQGQKEKESFWGGFFEGDD